MTYSHDLHFFEREQPREEELRAESREHNEVPRPSNRKGTPVLFKDGKWFRMAHGEWVEITEPRS